MEERLNRTNSGSTEGGEKRGVGRKTQRESPRKGSRRRVSNGERSRKRDKRDVR